MSIVQISQQWQLQAARKSIILKNTIWLGMPYKCERKLKGGIFIKPVYSVAKNEYQLRAGYSILPVWHTEWAFQRQTWEENVCSCIIQQQPQGALFHQNTGRSSWTMKIMTQMADKDTPCTSLCFLLPTPHLCFQFAKVYQDGGSRQRLLLREKRREAKERGSKMGTSRAGKRWQSGEEQTGFKSNRQATGCWRGWGWVKE